MNFNQLTRRLPAFLLFSTSLFLSSCASVKPVSTLQPESEPLPEGRHFKQEYVEPGTNFAKFKKVKVYPVDMRRLKSTDKKFDAAKLLRLAQEFQARIEVDLARKYELVPNGAYPDEETLVVRAALLQLGQVRQFYIVPTSTTAFEAILSDAGTGSIVAEVKEQRTGRDGSDGAFKTWSTALVQLIQNSSAAQ